VTKIDEVLFCYQKLLFANLISRAGARKRNVKRETTYNFHKKCHDTRRATYAPRSSWSLDARARSPVGNIGQVERASGFLKTSVKLPSEPR
jgi:hypothetical protein